VFVEIAIITAALIRTTFIKKDFRKAFSHPELVEG
jgi:hypothetical protein